MRANIKAILLRVDTFVIGAGLLILTHSPWYLIGAGVFWALVELKGIYG